MSVERVDANLGVLEIKAPKKLGIDWTDRKMETSLMYPDLGSDFYPDCICFTIQKRTGVSIENVQNAITEGFKEGNTAYKNELDLQSEINKYIGTKTASMAKFNEATPTQKNIETWTHQVKNRWNITHPDQELSSSDFLGLAVKGLEKTSDTMSSHQDKALKVAKEGKNIIGSIYLNMPNGIQFNEAANWSGDSLGMMGKTTQDVFTGNLGEGKSQLAGAMIGSAGNVVGAAVGAIPSLISKLGISGGMFGAAIGAMAAGGPIQKGAESALGIAQNPYMEMMFSGIGFRKFSFEFILRPKSQTEVQSVAEIIKMFRTHSKPSYTQGDLGKSFMNYPMEFKIDFLTTGAKKLPTGAVRNDGDNFMVNPNIPRLKDCVCDNVTTNYTPQNIWTAYKQGAPIAVNLSLSFQETELVMADDVYSENY